MKMKEPMHAPDLIDALTEIDNDCGNPVVIHTDCAIMGAELGAYGIELIIDCHCEVDFE